MFYTMPQNKIHEEQVMCLISGPALRFIHELPQMRLLVTTSENIE